MIPVIWLINNGYNSNNFLSLGAVSLNRFALRYSLPVLMLALSGNVSAIGLGELRGQPVLGERIQLEIDLLGVEKQKIDASCFRLVQPTGSGELPWLKKAGLSVRKGAQPVLEIRSEAPLREPIVQLAVQMGCGHEISRDYILMASPARGASQPVVEPPSQDGFSPPAQPPVRQSVKVRSVAPAPVDTAPRLSPRKAEKRPMASRLPDRLMLSDATFVGEPSLRLATDLFMGGAEAKETQREILRLEFRMLMAMHEQATSQMAVAEKLRNMEGTLGELQQRAVEFAQRVEKDGAAPAQGAAMQSGSTPASSPPPPTTTSAPAAEASIKPAPKSPPYRVDSSSGLSNWGLYGVLLGTVLGLAGWLGWRSYRVRRQGVGEDESSFKVPEVKVDPKRAEEREEFGGVDLPFEPAAMGMPMQMDVELDSGNESLVTPEKTPERAPAQGHDSLMSINATTLDEHFEVNPVMELADIMLSFGRVKGAAQALQEYIDHNPQEALQPWIRLMDVYRMAGMRAEFENVARNLNQHFNVEVQSWGETKPGVSIPSPDNQNAPVAARPQSLEDLPRLMSAVVNLWDVGDVVGYLYQLLRDNRGGQRLGFAMPVVEDILFLIELKETANRMENV
jgi:hypothetical protein